ncbi:pyrroline-5-carboxylate reductase 1, mitochondrial-like isoform X3 [Oratosquilla oratoria]
MQPAHIGFIGCGNMTQALLNGFIRSGLVEPTKVIVSAPSDKNLSKVCSLGITTTHDNDLVVASSDLIFLSVKSEVLESVINDLKPIEGDHNPLFVSIVGGLTIHDLEMMLLSVTAMPRVVRTMPNTPSMISQGCCVYSLGSEVTPEEGHVVQELLSAVAVCEMVPEHLINAAAGLSGSGPAYIYMAIEALADGGVKMGLSRHLAQTLAAQTVKGAAAMVMETGKHPAQLKDEACSFGGMTISGIHTLEKHGIRNALISAVEASSNKSNEIDHR